MFFDILEERLNVTELLTLAPECVTGAFVDKYVVVDKFVVVDKSEIVDKL